MKTLVFIVILSLFPFDTKSVETTEKDQRLAIAIQKLGCKSDLIHISANLKNAVLSHSLKAIYAAIDENFILWWRIQSGIDGDSQVDVETKKDIKFMLDYVYYLSNRHNETDADILILWMAAQNDWVAIDLPS